MSVLRTSFGLEELRYLAALPEEVHPGVLPDAIRISSAEQAWTRSETPTHMPWVRCVRLGCGDAFWGHLHDGLVYWRHGEALVSYPQGNNSQYIDSQTVAELAAWLDAVHEAESLVPA